MTGSVTGVYGAWARRYERRWSRYLDATITATLDALPTSGTGRVLDVGCGTGLLLHNLAARHPAMDLIGIDLTLPMLDVARQERGDRLALAAGDARALPFAGWTFDAVVSSSSLHHWPLPHLALSEVARVSRPGACLVITDWCADVLRFRPLAAYLRLTDRSVHRIYTRHELEELLANAGFSILSARTYSVAGVWGLMTIVARLL